MIILGQDNDLKGHTKKQFCNL